MTKKVVDNKYDIWDVVTFARRNEKAKWVIEDIWYCVMSEKVRYAVHEYGKWYYCRWTRQWRVDYINEESIFSVEKRKKITLKKLFLPEKK